MSKQTESTCIDSTETLWVKLSAWRRSGTVEATVEIALASSWYMHDHTLQPATLRPSRSGHTMHWCYCCYFFWGTCTCTAGICLAVDWRALRLRGWPHKVTRRNKSWALYRSTLFLYPILFCVCICCKSNSYLVEWSALFIFLVQFSSLKFPNYQ